ncbi:MAG: hypothetical protein ACYCTI_10825 [Acidimicrobiales bacterium]
MTTKTTSHAAVPQVQLISGRPFGQPPACAGCGGVVDTDGEYYVCLTQVEGRRCILAAAHPGTWGDDDSYDDTCPGALRDRWDCELVAMGAGRIVLGRDGGGPRFFLGGEPLHAGTTIELADPAGGWVEVRFEYRFHPEIEPVALPRARRLGSAPGRLRHSD